MLDGEIVVFGDGGRQDFDALGQRIHPAESRDRAARRARPPPRFIAFDLLARDDDALLDLPYEERRAALEEARRDSPVDLTPCTRDPRRPSPGCTAPRA